MSLHKITSSPSQTVQQMPGFSHGLAAATSGGWIQSADKVLSLPGVAETTFLGSAILQSAVKSFYVPLSIEGTVGSLIGADGQPLSAPMLAAMPSRAIYGTYQGVFNHLENWLTQKDNEAAAGDAALKGFKTAPSKTLLTQVLSDVPQVGASLAGSCLYSTIHASATMPLYDLALGLGDGSILGYGLTAASYGSAFVENGSYFVTSTIADGSSTSATQNAASALWSVGLKPALNGAVSGWQAITGSKSGLLELADEWLKQHPFVSDAAFTAAHALGHGSVAYTNPFSFGLGAALAASMHIGRGAVSLWNGTSWQGPSDLERQKQAAELAKAGLSDEGLYQQMKAQTFSYLPVMGLSFVVPSKVMPAYGTIIQAWKGVTEGTPLSSTAQAYQKVYTHEKRSQAGYLAARAVRTAADVQVLNALHNGIGSSLVAGMNYLVGEGSLIPSRVPGFLAMVGDGLAVNSGFQATNALITWAVSSLGLAKLTPNDPQNVREQLAKISVA